MTHDYPPQFGELIGKTALVTGSSSGIGRAIALELGRAGAEVVVHAAHQAQGARDVASAIEADGGRATVRLCDFREHGAVLPAFVEDVWHWRDGLDILVNNAGADVLTADQAHQSFEEKLHALWEVDVRSTIMLSRLSGMRMASRGAGVIVNIGWDQATQGMAGDSAQMFAATKAAIMGFTPSLARSLSPHVRVNCVAPGWIRTAWGEAASDSWQQRAIQESLMQRWGRPEDVAAAVRFLVSKQASFINGQTIRVNGGWTSSESA